MKNFPSFKRTLFVTIFVVLCGVFPVNSPRAYGLSVSIGEPVVDSQGQKRTVPVDNGLALFLFGAFCALWAQNTGRDAWLWFFMGILFSVITVIVLLEKNSTDNFDRKVYGRTTRDLPP